MALPIRVMPPEVMARDIGTDCATDAVNGRCSRRWPSAIGLRCGDDKKPSPGVRIGDGFSHCASACVPKDGLMVHLLRLMKG